MNILMTIGRAESRVLSMAKALQACGHRVHITGCLVGGVANPIGVAECHRPIFDEINSQGPMPVDEVDIHHHHVQRGQHSVKDSPYPIVNDIHDLFPDQDLPGYHEGGVYIVPSNGYRAYLQEKGPTFVVMSKVASAFWPDQKLRVQPKFNATALIAAVNRREIFRDYRWANENCRSGRLFVFHGGPIEQDPNLAHMNFFPQQDYRWMLKKVCQFRWGWADAANDCHEINICVTRKFWEYVACGVLPYTSEERSQEMDEIMNSKRWFVQDPMEDPHNDQRCAEYEVPQMITAYETAIERSAKA